MKFKLMIVGIFFTSGLAFAGMVAPTTHQTDDDGDLNPQPLPPISEEG